jgi:pyruvate-formate lyase-activating enzyme
MGSWPGRVAATVVVGSPSPALASGVLDLAADRRLAAAAVWAGLTCHLDECAPWLDGVVVRGGEPTDDPDLPSLLAALAERGVSVCLRTNGTRPGVIRHLLAEQLVVAVSVEVRTTPERCHDLTGLSDAAVRLRETKDAVVRSGVENEFRTRVDDDSVAVGDLHRIASRLRGARLYVIERRRGAGGASGVPGDAALREAVRTCSLYLPTVIRAVA